METARADHWTYVLASAACVAGMMSCVLGVVFLLRPPPYPTVAVVLAAMSIAPLPWLVRHRKRRWVLLLGVALLAALALVALPPARTAASLGSVLLVVVGGVWAGRAEWIVEVEYPPRPRRRRRPVPSDDPRLQQIIDDAQARLDAHFAAPARGDSTGTAPPTAASRGEGTP